MASKLIKSFGQSIPILTNSLKCMNETSSGALSSLLLVRNHSAAAYTSRYSEFETIQVTSPYDHVLHVQLNRPEKRNAMNQAMFRELLHCFHEINDDKQCRAVVVSGTGKIFSAGLDFTDMIDMIQYGSGSTEGDDVARRAKFLRTMVVALQKSFNVMSKCAKPVIAATHGGCIGAGLDLVCSVDIRYCSQDAYFSAREVNLGMVADLGTLQRMPKICGNDSLVREIVFTGKDLPAKEAKEMGLVSGVFADQETTQQAAFELAKQISTKSPVAVQGSKIALNYSRNHTIRDGLEFMANWNMCMLQSEDLVKAATATATKSEKSPDFADL